MSIPVSVLPLYPVMGGSGRAFGIPKTYRLAPRSAGARLRYASRFGGLIRENTSKLAKLRSGCTAFGSRLSSKIFLASALVIIVLASVGALSLGAVGRLVSANREITGSTIPALTVTASAREAMPRLLALEARALVLRDGRYSAAWTELATRVTEDLAHLAAYPLSEQEMRYHREASAAFEGYRRIVAEEQVRLQRGDRAGAMRLTDNAAGVLAEQVQKSLDAMMSATRVRVVAAQAEAARLERRTWTAVLIALGTAVGLALLGTAVIARRMTRSLELLSSATAEVAANKFTEPIVIDSRDEIGALARSFNSMASELRQVEEAKRTFFETVSHELRSPLTSIRGAVDLLHAGDPGTLTERQERLTDIIGQSSERLLRLANQILEMSRLRAGLMELERKPLDLAGLVDRVVEELHPQAEEAGVSLEHELYGSRFMYLGDEERLHQLVINLGANAIRFTPRGGRIFLRLTEANPEFELQVEDTGVGIPAKALPTIFDPYRQAHRDRGGTGLGLAIVQGVAKAHGGRVTAESCEGQGTCFTVLLPRS
jgi:signal transduction histidine kinase